MAAAVLLEAGAEKTVQEAQEAILTARDTAVIQDEALRVLQDVYEAPSAY